MYTIDAWHKHGGVKKKLENLVNSLSLKFTLEQAAKAQRGSRGIALLFPEPQH
jgi:hypothetical protein